MRRNEFVSDFYDRLNILISSAWNALEDSYSYDAKLMMHPVLECAFEAFLRGLPDDMARYVDVRNPKNLDKAVEYAIRFETRIKFGIFSSHDESYKLFLSRQNGPHQKFRSNSTSQHGTQTHFSIHRNRPRSPSTISSRITKISESPTGILKSPRNTFEQYM